MAVNVQMLLELKEFSNSRVLSGANGLKNEVKSVTVAEVPDSALWLKSGELVLTTGYFIRENESSQLEWINSIIEKGASALAIKTDRFLITISKSILDLANEKSFPIIGLPPGITWPTLIEGAMNKINETQYNIITTTSKIHSELTTLVITGQGIQVISDTISNLVGNVIIVEDIYLNVLSVSNPYDSIENLEEQLEYRLSQKYRERFKSSNFYKNINKYVYKKCYKNYLDKREILLSGKSQIKLPIIADSTVLGFITLVEVCKESNELDFVALEHGGTVVALELMQEQIIRDSNQKRKRFFLNRLLGLHKGDENRSHLTKDTFMFTLSKPVISLFIEIDKIDCSYEYSYNHNIMNKKDRDLTDLIDKLVNDVDIEGFFLNEGNTIEILIHFSPDNSKDELIRNLRDFCNKIISGIKQIHKNFNYNIGIGGIHYELFNIKKTYEESKRALEIGKLFFKEDQIHFYDEQGFYKLLFLVDNREDVIEYSNSIIGPLKEFDKKNDEDLCHVLLSYILNDGNIAQTAKELFVNPNTLTYRLKKIESILDLNLKDIKDKFNIYLAFMLQKIL